MAITNATRLSDFAAGIGTEGAILQIDNVNQRIGIGTQLPNQMLTVAGNVSATSFVGDGSLLEGIKSAGLGTAISDVDGSAGAVVYYTDDLLTVTETTTVNPPASASAAYTQYRDVKLEDNADLIIETGDDFIPDVLGLGPDESDPNAAGNGVFDEVYAGVIKNKNGLGAPAFANGLTSVGIGTFSSDVSIGGTLSVTGNVSVGGTLTYEDVKNVDSVGLITARTGIKVTAGNIDISSGNVNILADNKYLKIGAGADLQFVHTGGETFITNSTGSLTHRSDIHKWENYAGGSEYLRLGSSGQLGIAGANYGTAGQVFTSGGASAAPQWTSPAGGAWEVVSTKVLTGSDTYLDFNNWSNAYQKYQLVFNDVYYGHTNFRIWLRIYKDATSGNTGTLKTASNGYISNSSSMTLTTSGISAAWSGWIDYHKLGNNHQGEKWDGTYTFYMGQPTSTPSGNNECTWIGQSIRERDISPTDAGAYVADQSQYLTGIRLYFIENSSDACSPTAGRFTLYRMKYS